MRRSKILTIAGISLLLLAAVAWPPAPAVAAEPAIAQYAPAMTLVCNQEDICVREEMNPGAHYVLQNEGLGRTVEFWVEYGMPMVGPTVYYMGKVWWSKNPQRKALSGNVLPGTTGIDSIEFEFTSPAEGLVYVRYSSVRWKYS